jgi:hypothetical protein
MGVTFTAIRTYALTDMFGVFSAHDLSRQPAMRKNVKPPVAASTAIRMG